MTALDLSADVGLLAVCLATANLCLGSLIAVRYSPVRFWPHRRINIFAIHQWTAYALLATIVIHPIVLLFSKTVHWRWVDVGLPLWSPVQPLANSIGAAGLYLTALVVITSYYRLQLGRRRWKLLHFLIYGAAACAFIHGILANPRLTQAPVDPWDGEKLLVESCLLIVVVTTAWALVHRLHKSHSFTPLPRTATVEPLVPSGDRTS